MVDGLKRGDTVVCKVKDSAIVESYQKYDEKMVFEIISVSYQGWHIYIPSYKVIKNSVPITQKNYKSLGIDPRFIDGEAFFLTSSFIVKAERIMTGLVCKKCNEYFEFAEPNQDDGTLICFVCRRYPIYKSRL